jgi:hypothetical protein
MISSAHRTASDIALMVAGTLFPPSNCASLRASRILAAINSTRNMISRYGPHGFTVTSEDFVGADLCLCQDGSAIAAALWGLYSPIAVGANEKGSRSCVQEVTTPAFSPNVNRKTTTVNLSADAIKSSNASRPNRFSSRQNL